MIRQNNYTMTLYRGNPEFPVKEPQKVLSGASTNETDVIYIIETFGAAVTLGAGVKSIDENGAKSASVWASVEITGRLYGRFTNVGGNGTLACYEIVEA